MEPLITIPSPRDIPIVKEALDKITEYDKLWIKYSPEHITYPIIRGEILKNPRYTHLVICPDDLLIDDKNKLETLFKDYEAFENPDKIILSGYCNVDTSENSKYANVTQYHVSNERAGREYRWFTLQQLEENSKYGNFLIEVQFSGFALMVIPRQAIEEIRFRNDSWTGNFDSNGCCIDIMFCNDVIQRGYKIYVDSRVRLQHLKHSDQNTSKLLQQNPKFENDYRFYYEYKS